MKVLMLSELLEMLSIPNVLVGIILTAVGFATMLIAKRVTMAVRKTDKIKNNDNLYLVLLAFALVLILVGLIVSITRPY